MIGRLLFGFIITSAFASCHSCRYGACQRSGVGNVRFGHDADSIERTDRSIVVLFLQARLALLVGFLRRIRQLLRHSAATRLRSTPPPSTYMCSCHCSKSNDFFSVGSGSRQPVDRVVPREQCVGLHPWHRLSSITSFSRPVGRACHLGKA